MTEILGSMIAAARGTVPEVAPAEAYEAQQRDEVHLIIDVREPQEFADAHVRNSVNVPCRRNMGYDSVEVLGGGLNGWTEAGLPVEICAS